MIPFLVYFVFILFQNIGYATLTEVVEPHWDLLIFTQSWPVTVCREWKDKNESHHCTLPIQKSAWTIHGIWPTRYGSIGPSFCNKTWHFDPKEIKPIESDLVQYWTNVETETSTYSLWAHEWSKHGTCAAVIKELDSQIKYFTQGLNWIQDYMVSDILKVASIVPSDDKIYSIVDINRVLKDRLGVDPVIECHKEHGQNLLGEIRICFDAKLNLANCDGVITRKQINGDSILTNCDSTLGISYLQDVAPKPQRRFFVESYKFVTWLQWLTL